MENYHLLPLILNRPEINPVPIVCVQIPIDKQVFDIWIEVCLVGNSCSAINYSNYAKYWDKSMKLKPIIESKVKRQPYYSVGTIPAFTRW